MSDEILSCSEMLERLAARNGPAERAWITRVHLELERLCPNEFVIQSQEDLDDVIEWMDATGVPRQEEALHFHAHFDSDR
ncbi:MAG TPA: hypothetical protein VFU47_11350, partial [Armatimonadota bacterium]|nr:hypothetical protein [Armatimonadota bacterium]